MYIQPNSHPQAVGGLWDDIKDILKKGAAAKYGPQKEASVATPPPAAIAQPTFMDKYGTLLLIGGLGLGAVLLLRRKR